MTYYSIPFNIPISLDNTLEHIEQVLANRKLCGDGPYTKKCNDWFIDNVEVKAALLTTSCTSALELSAMLLNLEQDDEVIMPSFTFVSTALAFVMNGARIVFVDIRPDTMNMDERLVEDAITERTRAIVPVHYAGVSCDMNTLCDIGKKYNLPIIEDAAQGMAATYNKRPLGSLGSLATYSFHETKNYTCGEGGVLLINEESFIERAEILREKGTNRSKYHKGMVDKYTWVDKGSSWLPSELNAAYLYPQLLVHNEINHNRLSSWDYYYTILKSLSDDGHLELPSVPSNCIHNAHMFYIKVANIEVRTELISHLGSRSILAVFHYIPLHSSPAGLKWGRFNGEDKFTTKESERLLRLPMYYGLHKNDIDLVVEAIFDFFKSAK